MDGLQRLYLGEFNDMTKEASADGSVIITLTSRRDDVTVRFRVRDLYGEHEELLEEEELAAESRPWIRARMEEAQRRHGKGRPVDQGNIRGPLS